jgi:anti-sigma regulatory factor (Ser/Thr protein kinase)
MTDAGSTHTASDYSQPDDLCVHVPAAPESLAGVRRDVAAFLDAHEVDEDLSYGALAVAHELAANAVAHGSREGDEIEVRAEIRDDRLALVVTDAARRAGVPVALTPDEHRERGRGLLVVERLADWSESIVEGRREVRAELRL